MALAKNKNFIITISGTPGSGKSTVAKKLAKKFQAKRIYIGGLWRQMAKEKKLTLEELNKFIIKNPDYDKDMDKKIAEEARRLSLKSPVIVEGRVQFAWLPESIKLFITAQPQEAARRVWQQIQNEGQRKSRNEAKISSLAQLKAKQQYRLKNDQKRYKKLYKIDYTDHSQYDFVLDTTAINAQEATAKAADFIENKLN